MKKSIRILSFLMAFAMLIGSFSVMGSAYEAYKDSAVSYNDVDAPEFSTEQYASMGLDEVDRMLAKEKIVLDIYIGTLDLGSIDTALTSLFSLVESVSNLLPLLGDASSLTSYITPLEGISRTANTDVEVIQALFNFIAKIAPLGEKYVNGTISLGIMNSFIADFVFDVRELAIGLLFGLSNEGKAMGELDENGKPEGYDYMDDLGATLPAKYKEDDAAVTLLQTLINDIVLGEWKMLDDEFDDPYSNVNYYSYGFREEYGETKHDTANYDYYGWVHPNQWVTVGLGGFKRVTAGEAAPPADYANLDINSGRSGYEFIENLLQAAYNYILIPVLNRDTVQWVREECGIVYDEKYTRKTIWNGSEWVNNTDYNPDYAGEVPTDDAELDAYIAELRNKSDIAKLFKLKTAVTLPTATIPETTTLVDYFNTLLGDFLAVVAEPSANVNGVDYFWTWDYGTNPNGDNTKLFKNICNVGRYVLQVTGESFFGETAFKEEFPNATALASMNDQQVVSLVLRGILNSSVDYIYVEPSYDTLVDVGYRATEQLAWQDIPQFTYTKPVRTSYTSDAEYYYAVVDKMITILFDIAVYNLNQGMDMVPAKGSNPVNNEGLLQYQGDTGHYRNLLVQIAAWAFSDYAPLLSVGKNLLCYNETGSAAGLTEDMVWQDLDTIVDSLIPIKGGEGKEPWIAAEIAGDGTNIVSKAFIFDYILKPLYTLDATNLATIFKRNENGAFANKDGVEIIIDILANVFNLLFPGVFQTKGTIDEILNNELLGTMVSDLLKSLGTETFVAGSGATVTGRANDIILVGLPIICQILGLSDDQDFEEMEIYLPETIAATGALPTFEVINGSSGINTYYTAADGSTTQDKLYEYEIQSINLNTYNKAGSKVQTLSQTGLTAGAKISGGESVDVTLTGTRAEGDVLEFTVNYFIYGEDGNKIDPDPSTESTIETLSKTVYAYVGNTDKDDDAITEHKDAGSDRRVEYEKSIYLSTNDGLDDIENYNLRVKDNEGGSAAALSLSSVTMASTAYPFVAKNPGTDDSKPTSHSMSGQAGLYFISPFALANKADGEPYERLKYTYQVDEETGELVLDANDDPIPVSDNGGVEDGAYKVTSVLSVGGTSVSIDTNIHLYNDYGLDSLFSRAVAANRQLAQYDTDSNYGAAAGLYSDYQTALMNAARLVLMPKNGDTFQTDIAASSSEYENRYEELADALEKSIEALEEYKKDEGIQGLKDAIDAVSGINYTVTSTAGSLDGEAYTILEKENIEYYEADYTHFGMRDYVPHTYNRYKDARRLAESIINSQEFFAPENPADIEYHVPSNEEIQRYNEAMEDYIEARLNITPVNSIEATYAIHMIELMSSRLIRLPGNTSKLENVVALYAHEDTSTGTFVGTSKEDYDNAVDFANAVLAESDPRPSKINTAISELVEAWKELELACDTQNVDGAISAANAIIVANGEDPAAESCAYTEDSYRAFLVAYNDALRVKNENPYTENESDKVDAVALALTTAQNNLVPKGAAGGADPVIEFKGIDEGMYWDASYSYTFVPKLTEGAYNHKYFDATLEDGTVVDGFVVGYGIDSIYDESYVTAPFNLQNCTAEVTPNSLGMYNTGAVVKFIDNSGNVVKTYIVVVVADVDGDGAHSTSDQQLMELNLNFASDWEWDGVNHYKCAAYDITNDGMIDTADINIISLVNSNAGTINQEVPASGTSCYIAF